MADITIPASASSDAIVEVSYINTGWLPNAIRREIIATQSNEVFDMPVLCFVVKKGGKVYIWVRIMILRRCYRSFSFLKGFAAGFGASRTPLEASRVSKE
jgi:hypothetical protein